MKKDAFLKLYSSVMTWLAPVVTPDAAMMASGSLIPVPALILLASSDVAVSRSAIEYSQADHSRVMKSLRPASSRDVW